MARTMLEIVNPKENDLSLLIENFQLKKKPGRHGVNCFTHVVVQ